MNTYTIEQYEALIAVNATPINYELRNAAIDYLKQNPAVGMPATFGIGSDSYAMVVTDVIRFKTGAKTGQVKAVIAKNENENEEKFYVTKSGRIQKRDNDGYSYGSLTIGFARDYRDPNF